MMTFLTLNGWSVPTLRGSKGSPIIIGEEERAFDGTIMRDRRKYKRKWSYTSSSLDQQNAEALIATVMGKGDTYSFDDDLYSGKGMAPLNSTIGSRRIGVDPDGRSIVDLNGEAESYFGTHSLIVEPAVTNLFSADTRDAENAPTGYNAVIVTSSSLAANTTYQIQETKSVRCISGGTGDGIESDTVVITPGNHTATVYVYATSAKAMAISFVNASTGVASSSTAFTTVANTWVRVTDTQNPAYANLRIRIWNNSGAALTFYCDAWQLEEGTQSTTWADPTRAAGDLEIPAGFLDRPSFTFAAWIRGPTSNPASTIYIFRSVDQTYDDFRIYRTAANTVYCYMKHYGSSTNVNYSNPWDDAWHHIAVTARASDGYVALYYDGSEVDNETFTNFPDFTAFATNGFYLGHDGGADFWDGLIDDLVLVPYAATADQIDAWYKLGIAHPTLPRVRAEGEFHETFPAPSGEASGELVEGIATEITYGGVVVDGTFRNNAQRITFELESV